MIVDGACKVQLFLIAPASVAYASTSQIKVAAQAIYDKCGAGIPSKGGIATNIGMHNRHVMSIHLCLIVKAGGDNKLAVVLGASSYPGVICDAGRAPSRVACNDILSDMNATLTRRLFGPDLVAPNVKLPYLLMSGKLRNCPRLFELSDINGTIVD